MLTQKFFLKGDNAKMFWRGAGSFGEINGEILRDAQSLGVRSETYTVTCTYSEDKNGVITRDDVFKNISNGDIELTSLKSRFVFEGGEYEVYTQYNNWQTENIGSWQPLVTGITASCASTRSTQDAAPFIVLWSKQQSRGVVFHLLPNCAWEIKVTHVGLPQRLSKVMVELGPIDYNMSIKLAPGEEVKLPQIICYETGSRLDFDCYKLHSYMHRNYPRREVPMIYNTWMYKYTAFTPELLYKQAQLAAKMGLEYFVIDAGWFGREGMNWFDTVGDWVENTTGGFYGKMKEFADKIRALGLKFGLWLEPERATDISRSVEEHPDYYIADGDQRFLDFANKEAREWMLSVVSNLIDTYGIEYIKFDYNANLFYDKLRSSFMKYYEGFDSFMKALRQRYPNLYMTGCAGGGERTELANYIRYDSFWPSDNESPYEEMRIYKESLYRMPPQGFERWTCVHSLKGYDDFYAPYTVESKRPSEKIIACCDAWWYDIAGVHPSYLDAYHTGGPIGFSCDLSEISDKDFEHFKEVIAVHKSKRDFWKTAVARIIADTDSVTVYQYSDEELTDIVVQIVSDKAFQNEITVYPVVCADKMYLVNEETKMSGAQILREGIDACVKGWHEMTQLCLKEIK